MEIKKKIIEIEIEQNIKPKKHIRNENKKQSIFKELYL